MRITAVDVVDVFVYLVVLCVFVQFLPEVIAETFVVSLLTAVLLKIVLELVLAAKKLLVGRLRSAAGAVSRIIAVATLLLLLPGSKLLVLWLTDLAFGDAVHLGGFWSVTLLVITLTLARAGVRAVFATQERPKGSA